MNALIPCEINQFLNEGCTSHRSYYSDCSSSTAIFFMIVVGSNRVNKLVFYSSKSCRKLFNLPCASFAAAGIKTWSIQKNNQSV